MILLLGPTGLLGSHVLVALLDRRLPLRILARGEDDWRQSPLAKLRAEGVEVFFGDAENVADLEKAMSGCRAVINTIGTLSAKTTDKLIATNKTTVENILTCAQSTGIKRIVHVSCLGARSSSPSVAMKAKWESEQLVRGSEIYWTIFRPSFLFADIFPLFDLVEPLAKFRPFLPVIGSGTNIIQPISANCVAEAMVESIYDRDCVSKCYELAGTTQFTMNQFMELARGKLGLGGSPVNIPLDKLTTAQEVFAKAIPGNLKNSDLLKLLTVDSLTEKNDLEAKFGMQSDDLEASLANIEVKR
jgi:NADH dehydrogenase